MSDETQSEARRPRNLAHIERMARRAERRMRFGRALAAGTAAACVALLVVAVAIVLRKTEHLGEARARAILVLSGLVTLLVALLAYLRPLAQRAGAVALDRHHRLADRLSSALSFAALPAAERSPFMDAAIDDALQVSGSLDPRRAVPIRAPRDLAAALGLAVAVGAIALFKVHTDVPVATAKTIDAFDVTADDVDAMREFVRDMELKDQSDETKAAVQEFNQLIEDLAAKRLDKTEAFRRMQALEDKLLEGREADKKALEDALQKIGEEMKKAELTKPAGEALDNKNLVDAEKQLRDLAKKLREQGAQMNKEQLEKMRDALKRSAEDNAKRQQAIAERREELQKDLLSQRQKQPDGGGTEEEKSLLHKKERELERLNREEEQAQSAGRQLDRLDRELAQAAEDLMKDLGASAKDLEQSAEDINRMAKDEMSQEEKEALRDKLRELRDTLRQQQQGGQGQMVRLQRFQSHARGQQGQGGQGQQGQGQQGQEGQDGQQGENGQGDQGSEGQRGQGQNGQGQGQNGQGGQSGQRAQRGQNGAGQGQGGSGETWIVGPNGEKILMISQGQGQGQGGQGQGQGNQNGGDGQGQSNPHGWGTGHDGNVQAGATNPKVGTEDTQVAGQDTGQGASRSEVIQGAAERGFASRGYTKVYREYHSVAEEAISKDEIPGGYRFYVRRYFQLIRPREEQ